MRLLLAAASRLILVLVPFTALALGLGDISLDSALNEPFSAEIPLDSVSKADLAELRVSLASRETFQRYGLDKPDYLNSLRFNVGADERGQPVVRVTSTQPVSEPFVTMLLDVRWASGRLLREYTVLLDPPLFEERVVAPDIMPAQTAPETESPAAGEVVRAEEPVPVYNESEVVESTGLFQSEAVAEEVEPAVDPVAEVAEPAAQPMVSESAAPNASPEVIPAMPVEANEPTAAEPVDDSYTIREGDTLWSLAERSRGDTGLSTNQMMLALYRANPEAFAGNINALRAGSVLRVPGAAEAVAPEVAQANAEVMEQHEEWSGQESSAEPIVADAEVAPEESESLPETATAEPAVETDAVDPAGQAEQVAEEARLQLVAPTEPAEGEIAGDGTAEAGDQVAADESAEAGEAVAADESAGSGDADAAGDERLLQIEDEEMQALQGRIDEGAAPGEEELAVDEGQIFVDESESGETTDEASVEAGAETDTAGSAASAVVTEDAGSIFTSLWLWVGAAAVLLVALFLAWRRKADKEDAAATGSWVTDIEPAESEDELADFSEFEVPTDSIVVEEDISPVLANADPEQTLDESAARDEAEVSEDDFDPFAMGDDAPADEIIEAPVAEEPEAEHPAVVDDLPEISGQEASGQDEVELPLEKTISTGAPLNLDQADPIAEAEFHMAYGLYDQAAELLVNALESDADNRAYRVKLIEVFFVWENKEGFLEQAQLLRNSTADGNDSDWSKVLILGKQLCPDEALFADDDGGVPIADGMDLELSEGGETEVDFSLGDSDEGASDVDMNLDSMSEGDEGGLDFDIGVSTMTIETEEDNGLTLNLNQDSGADVAGEPKAEGDDSEAGLVDLDLGDLSADLDAEAAAIEGEAVADDAAATMETPTIEAPLNEPTMESPTLEAPGVESETAEMPLLDESDELDIDLSGLAELPIDSGDLGAVDLSGDEDTGESAGEISAADSDEPVFAGDETYVEPETENILMTSEDKTVLANLEDMGTTDLDLGEATDVISDDTVEQMAVDVSGDTAEQPAPQNDEVDLLLDEGTAEIAEIPEDATMTEVGTKLDLAKAYIDMGDPDGARSILNEVVEEGGEVQQQQARQLLEELSD